MKFKDSTNRWITSGLFKELAQTNAFILYTLDDARKSFIKLKDPTGYLYSEKYLGGYPHWLALRRSPTVEPHILMWEAELEVKIRAEALQDIYKRAKGENGYQAAKYLVEAGWIKNQKGRPTKRKIKEEGQKQARMYEEFGLSVVK